MIKTMRFLQLFNVEVHYAEKKQQQKNKLKPTNKMILLYQREQQHHNLVGDVLQFQNS